MDVFTWSLPFVGEKITDMLIAILNCYSKEELEEEDRLEEANEATTPEEETQQRRQVIKNKILAVGRMSKVFALLREESEKVSELKSVSGGSKVPTTVLANASEEIKDSIRGFDDARKSDIENERLPPDLVDPEEYSNPGTPSEEQIGTGTGPGGFAAPAAAGGKPAPLTGLADAMSKVTGAPPSPGSPISPGGFRRGHSRQASLGTTMTSPSNRRRSVESTISLIREAVDGRGEDESELSALAESISSPGRPSSTESDRFVGGFASGHAPTKSQ